MRGRARGGMGGREVVVEEEEEERGRAVGGRKAERGRGRLRGEVGGCGGIEGGRNEGRSGAVCCEGEKAGGGGRAALEAKKIAGGQGWWWCR